MPPPPSPLFLLTPFCVFHGVVNTPPNLSCIWVLQSCRERGENRTNQARTRQGFFVLERFLFFSLSGCCLQRGGISQEEEKKKSPLIGPGMSSYHSPPPQSKWFLDDQILEEPNASFFWCGLNEHVHDLSVENNSLRPDVDDEEKRSSSKRLRSENGVSMPNKACREKMRRDRLNDRFLELSVLLEPGRTPSSDKMVILTNALHTIDELKAEAHQVTESNEKLRETIKKLKLEKSELRDEKQKLKAERERLEQEMKLTTLISSGYNMPHPASLHAAMAGLQAANLKPGVPAAMPMGMWQWMLPGALDTSQDHKLRPPVA